MEPHPRSPDRDTLLALVETSRAIAAEADLPALFQRIADRAAVVLRAEGASVLVLDSEGRELVFVCAAGRGADKLAGVRFEAEKGIAGQALASRRVVRADVAAQSEHFYPDID